MTDLERLLGRWEQEAELFRRCGALEAATTRESDITELREWLRAWQLEALTYEQAALYSGLAVGTIGNKVRAGEIPNVGKKNAPLVRRCDLPAKPPGPPDRDPDSIDLADKILARKPSRARS